MLLTYVGATTGTMIMFWPLPITQLSFFLLTLATNFCVTVCRPAFKLCVNVRIKKRRFPVFECFVRDAAMRAYPSQVSSLLTYFTRHGGPAVCLVARTALSLVGGSLFASELRLLELLLVPAARSPDEAPLRLQLTGLRRVAALSYIVLCAGSDHP